MAKKQNQNGMGPEGERVPQVNERLGASFTLPGRVSVRQQIAFRSYVSTARSRAGLIDEDSPEPDVFLPYWEAALKYGLIQDWQASAIPDPHKLDLDEETNPAVANVVIWTANTVAAHMLSLGGETTPKN